MPDSDDRPVQPAVPAPTWKDKMRTVAQGAVSDVPMVGGTVAALLEVCITPGVESRTALFLESVAERIDDLESEGKLNPDDLKDDPAFLDAVVQATRAAQATADRAKLDSLRDAVLNVAAGDAPGDDQRAMFMEYVDRFTGLHLRVLRILQDPGTALTRAGKAPPMMVGSVFGILKDAMGFQAPEDLLRQVARDLHAYGLTSIDGEGLNTTMSGGGTVSRRTTPRGDAFLRFVTRS